MLVSSFARLSLHGWCLTPFPGSCATFSALVTAGRAQSTPLRFSHLCSVKTQVWLNLELLLQSILPSSSAWCELSAAGLFVGVRYPKAE